ncbi:SRPBCC family protein [Streptomyces sp. YJ-C3]
MRLADGPQVESTIEIAAPAWKVWDLVSDIATSVRHSPELQEVQWLDGADKPAVGACFVGRNRNGGLGEWQTVSRIVTIEPERTFQWEVVYYDARHDNGEPLSVWTYHIEPTEDGSGTRLKHGMKLGTTPGPLHAVIERNPEREEQILDGRFAMLRTAIDGTLAGVRTEAEA